MIVTWCNRNSYTINTNTKNKFVFSFKANTYVAKLIFYHVKILTKYPKSFLNICAPNSCKSNICFWWTVIKTMMTQWHKNISLNIYRKLLKYSRQTSRRGQKNIWSSIHLNLHMTSLENDQRSNQSSFDQF